MLSDFPEHIQTQVKTLPEEPGVYQFFDREGKIIYVGKAKVLKNRVSSYFALDHSAWGKTRMLVKNICDIRYIVVNTELEALLLENSLIKKYQPKYNISLKDDKTYPHIVVKNEPFPRVFASRQPEEHSTEYYGPFASAGAMHNVLALIKQLFKLRSCNLNLTEENISKGKFSYCLEYQIGNCKAPCVGKQSFEDYEESMTQIRQILKGNLNELNIFLRNKMNEYAAKYDFESAQEIKQKYDLLEKFQSKSVVVNRDIKDTDVYSIESDEDFAYINYMKVMDGAIIQAYTLEMKKKLEETDAELLALAITELREKYRSRSKEIIVPIDPEIEIPQVKFVIPKLGDKKKLLELSQTNTKFYIKDKLKQLLVKDPERHTKRILEQMMKDLRMNVLPQHIECFDNSNFQGAFPVSAMVCFKDAKPSKKDYRHYNIKTVSGPNDFASMEEVIYRRYKRLQEEGEDLPQLIVIDGGKGQLGAALKSLELLGLRGKITVIGIAKKLEEIFYPGDTLPMYIDKRSETLKVIQHMRNEAHRFGITHYRGRHEKSLIKSELDDIKGIGPHTVKQLLKKFGSVKKIKTLNLETLTAEIGPSKAQIIHRFYHEQNT